MEGVLSYTSYNLTLSYLNHKLLTCRYRIQSTSHERSTYAMERDHISRRGCTHNHRQRTQQKVNPIVDDRRLSNPHSLLPWLKRQLQTFAPVNDPKYKTLPPAA